MAKHSETSKQSEVSRADAGRVNGERSDGKRKPFGNLEELVERFSEETPQEEEMDDILSIIGGDSDLEVVEEDAAEEEPAGSEPLRVAEPSPDTMEGVSVGGAVGKSTDPVRMYLREMGGVSLLTREGEVIIAKRIEEGQKDLLSEVLRSPVALLHAIETLS